MKRLVFTTALCAFAAPAIAQDDPIYAPCLLQFSALEEFGNASAYIAAMHDAGWIHVTDAPDRERAAAGLAVVHFAAAFLPSAFNTAGGAQNFVTRAGRAYQPSLPFIEVFARDGVTAAASETQFSPGQLTVQCTFAGSGLESMDDMLAQSGNTPFGLAMELAFVEVAEPEKTINLNVTAMRFVQDEATLAPLSVREGIRLTYTYELLQ